MKQIIVAVSGGPDSMALLDKLNNDKLEIIAAHVNYKMRDTADRDQKIVEDYCKKNGIKLEILNGERNVEGNFQAYARELRYNFMNDLANKYNIHEVYVAHHLDDALETYLLQKERGITPSYYGISEESKYKNFTIVRPFLDFTKEELMYYCQTNNVEFGIDESNETDIYERNRIRNTELKEMCIRDKKDLIEEIKELNEELLDRKKNTEENFKTFIQEKTVDSLLSFEDNELIDVLREWFTYYDIYNISNDEFDNLIDFIKSKKNGDYQLTNDYLLHKSYGNLVVVVDEEIDYSYTFDEIKPFKCEYFEITDKGNTDEGLTITEDDFPLTIRNYQRGDKIEMTFGSKNVSRFFIDRKIPSYERKKWPVVVNAKEEVVLVPGLGCNVAHFSNNPTMFVVK